MLLKNEDLKKWMAIGVNIVNIFKLSLISTNLVL